MARASSEVPVAVIGGGVVGVAVAHALAGRGVGALVLEAEHELARGASGTNSGILHTGFDSNMGELETTLILRSGELRDGMLANAGVPVLRCGATLTPRSEEEARNVAAVAASARAIGIQVTLRDDGVLEVPGEAVTDPWTEGPTVLAFFKVSCPVCKMVAPMLTKLSEGGARVVAVGQDPPEAITQYNESQGQRVRRCLRAGVNSSAAKTAKPK